MSLKGLKEPNDLDILVSPEVWQLLVDMGHKPQGDKIVPLDTDIVEIFKTWTNEVDPAAVLRNAEKAHGCWFASLEDVLNWKRRRGKPKDLVDAKIIEDYLAHKKRSAAALDDSSKTQSAALRVVVAFLSRQKTMTLYHIGRHPAYPKPKQTPDAFGGWGMVGMPGEKPPVGDLAWKRPWLKEPVKEGVFLTDRPVMLGILGIKGNVYAYDVPQWVIEEAGGMHRYHESQEILISKELWDKAGPQIKFLGKSMDKKKFQEEVAKADQKIRRNPVYTSGVQADVEIVVKKDLIPFYEEDEEDEKDEDKPLRFNPKFQTYVDELIKNLDANPAPLWYGDQIDTDEVNLTKTLIKILPVLKNYKTPRGNWEFERRIALWYETTLNKNQIAKRLEETGIKNIKNIKGINLPDVYYRIK